MFLIFIKQVISKTNNGLLMEISGGGGGGSSATLRRSGRREKNPPNPNKKKFYQLNRTKYLDCPYIYLYSKNLFEIPIF